MKSKLRLLIESWSWLCRVGSTIGPLLGDGAVQLWDALAGAKLPVSLRAKSPMNDFFRARTACAGPPHPAMGVLRSGRCGTVRTAASGMPPSVRTAGKKYGDHL